MPYDRDVQLDTRLSRSALPVLRSLRRTARRPAGERHPHRPDRARAQPADRRPGSRIATSTGSCSPPASATPRSSSGPTASAPPWRWAVRPTCSATSTTRSTSRTWPAPVSRSTTRSRAGLVGAVDLTCWRRDAGSLLLTLAKTTAEQIRQALLAGRGRAAAGPVEGVPAHLPPQGGHRLRPERRHGDVERLRPHGARSGRPGGAARAGQRSPDERAPRLARDRPALGADRPHVRPIGGQRRAARRHRRPRQAGTGRPRAAGPRPAGAAAAARPGRVRPAVAPCLPGGGAGVPLGRVARGGGRARGRQAGGAPRGAAAPAAGRPVPGPRRRRRRAATRSGCRAVRRAIAGDADTLVIRHVDTLDGRRLRALSSALLGAARARRRREPTAVGGRDPGARAATDTRRPLQLLQTVPEHRRRTAAAPAPRGPASPGGAVLVAGSARAGT